MAEEQPDTLSPPPPAHHSTEDPGAHELVDSDDHFSDARSDRSASRSASPIPITRVERVDHEASYGEVPGTEAYKMREEDARPDEIAFVEEDDTQRLSVPLSPGPIPTTVLEEAPPSPINGGLSRSNTHKRNPSDAAPDVILASPSASELPGGLPIPETHVERVDSQPAHGEVPGTDAYAMRQADAEPDSLEITGDVAGSPTSSAARSPRLSSANEVSTEATPELEEDSIDGDDFDDFEEGDDQAEFGDFGDFDDGFQEPDSVSTVPAPQSLPQIQPSFPSILDFSQLSSHEDIFSATNPYIDALFPPDNASHPVVTSTPPANSLFLTPRSASLWSQLVAPPPLQPSNWVRSRIRRLFLVSLGVPVDLDEILPSSGKQKKLILPSTAFGSRSSTDSRSATDRLKSEAGNGSSSEDGQSRNDGQSQGQGRSSRRKGPPPPPELDLVAARQLCNVTDEALSGYTIAELEGHVAQLKELEVKAKEVLGYWTARTDEKLGEREAFEGVVENLVQHARKIRK